MSSSALAVSGLSAWYGRARALWDVDVSVEAGQGVGVVGRNGAGKSTLLRSIARVHRGCSGEVHLGAERIDKDPPYAVAARGLSLVREGAPVFTQLSVLANLQLGQTLARRRGREAVPLTEVWSIFPVLETMTTRKAGLLSGGQRQMLALGTALVSSPTVLLLDEPSAGLAPEAAATTFRAIGELCRRGLGVLIAEQNHEWLKHVADTAIELESGRLVASKQVTQMDGTPQ